MLLISSDAWGVGGSRSGGGVCWTCGGEGVGRVMGEEGGVVLRGVEVRGYVENNTKQTVFRKH